MLGVAVDDFTWKGLLDLLHLHRVRACQSQCPAWNTDKPLSPKMLVMALRDHAEAKSPWLTASDEARGSLPAATTALAERPLIGKTGYEIGDPRTAYNPLGIGPDGEPSAIVDEDVLWLAPPARVRRAVPGRSSTSTTSSHRRYHTLIESAFPSELVSLFKNSSRMATLGHGRACPARWAKDLPFE